MICFFSKWCHQESNRGHKDFQSFALPTELWHLFEVWEVVFPFCVAKLVTFCKLTKFFGNFFIIFFTPLRHTHVIV